MGSLVMINVMAAQRRPLATNGSCVGDLVVALSSPKDICVEGHLRTRYHLVSLVGKVPKCRAGNRELKWLRMKQLPLHICKWA